MYCTHCGQQIAAEQVGVCPNCGAPLQNGAPFGAVPPQYAPPQYIPPMPPYPMQPAVSYAEADTILKVVCFFVPLVGIILYFIDRDEKPVSAKQCLKMSLIGMGVSAGISVLAVLIWMFFVMGMLAVVA